MEHTVITTDMMIVFFLLGLAIFLFVSDLLRVDLVGLLMMVLSLKWSYQWRGGDSRPQFQCGGVDNCGDDYWCGIE